LLKKLWSFLVLSLEYLGSSRAHRNQKSADILVRSYNFEDQLLMNIYGSAEKICYGDGIGIYFSGISTIANSLKSSYVYLKNIYKTLKEKIKSITINH